MPVGILGGTFDPPHIGHLILAEEAFHQLGLSRVLFVITPSPPHKQGWTISPLENRLTLVKMAIEDNPHFEISRVDIDRKPPHYAVDSMNILHQQFPQTDLIYLMGADSLRDLPTWHKANQFVESCDGIGVMDRHLNKFEMEDIQSKIPGIQSKVIWLTAPPFDISSREIRHRISVGAPYRYFLPQKVYQFIESEILYR